MINDITKRQQYARDFRIFASKQFDEMESTGCDVVMDVSQWHQFLFLTDLLPEDWGGVPTRDEKERWVYMHRTANRVRREMNRAAKTGDGGEPPFEFVVKNRRYLLRPLRSMALVSYGEVGEIVRTYLKNKRSELEQTHALLSDRVKSGDITGPLAAQVVQLDMAWNRAVKNASHQITGYLEDVAELKAVFDEQEKARANL